VKRISTFHLYHESFTFNVIKHFILILNVIISRKLSPTRKSHLFAQLDFPEILNIFLFLWSYFTSIIEIISDISKKNSFSLFETFLAKLNSSVIVSRISGIMLTPEAFHFSWNFILLMIFFIFFWFNRSVFEGMESLKLYFLIAKRANESLF